MPELLFIMVLALLIFGPRKLPEIGKTMGKAMGEFRRATRELKRTLDTEISAEEASRPVNPAQVNPAPAAEGPPIPPATSSPTPPATQAPAPPEGPVVADATPTAEPPREPETKSIGEKIGEIFQVMSDGKFALFIVLLGLFFWWPFWAFFNLCALYVDSSVDTASLYSGMHSVIPWLANFLSQVDEDGTRRILGETISHTGYIIMIFQIFVSHGIAKMPAMRSFMVGLFIAAIGFVVLGYASIGSSGLVFAGIVLFAVGEMIASPRIQEYITWIAPKEKAGMYMGANFLGTMIGGLLSGVYTGVYGRVDDAGHPERVWYILAAHMIAAILVFTGFNRALGGFEERSA